MNQGLVAIKDAPAEQAWRGGEVMSKFRKKPVVIEAFQVGSSRFYPEWLHEAVSANVVVTHAREGSDGWKEPFDHADIQTLEGVMRADRGDWIIRGVEGELYPCKDSIFRQTYEPAEDGESPAQPRRPYGTDTMSEYGVIPECDGPKPPAQEPMTDAATDVLAERRRQVEVEGWAPERDDHEHDRGQLARAAGCYALHSALMMEGYPDAYAEKVPAPWPWSPEWWKPKDARRNLVKAGALILAEIERLDRACIGKGESNEG